MEKLAKVHRTVSNAGLADVLDPLGAVSSIIKEICGHKQAMRQIELQMLQVRGQTAVYLKGIEAGLALEKAKIEVKEQTLARMADHADQQLAAQRVRGEAVARSLEMLSAAAVNPEIPVAERLVYLDALPHVNMLFRTLGEESAATYAGLTAFAGAQLKALPTRPLFLPSPPRRNKE